MTAAIETIGLTKRYGPTHGLFDLDLVVPQGEIFGFLGPNGAGKSTTIRLLMDLIRPDAGRAAVFGHDCRRDAREVHRRTGYLPGEFALDPKLTGRELVGYLGALRGGIDRTRVDEIAARLDLDLDRKFGEYSRGNKQKVGVVQAMMHRPELLILDEPTGGLDPLHQEEVLSLVREARDDGATVFFSSHILSEVEEVCGQVAFIRDGRLVRAGSVQEMLAAKGHHVEAECERPPESSTFTRLPGVSGVKVDGRSISFAVSGSMANAIAALAPYGVRSLASREPNLAELFLGMYEGETP